MKTTIVKTLLFVCLSLFNNKYRAQGSGEIRGIIKNTELETVPFATIKILQGNQLVGGTQTDENGRYSYKPLVPGTYEMVVMDPGHKTQPVNKITVTPNEATYVDVKLSSNTYGVVEIMAEPIDYTRTGVDLSIFQVVSMDAIDLNRNSGYTRGDVKGALESMTSDVVMTGDGEVHIRGARGDASGYFVDGVRTLKEATVPGLAIENISLFPGGVPAMYGDVSSGVVIITTKSYFTGIRDKNIRVAKYREQVAEERASEKAKEDEENRAREIEEEKAKGKTTK